MFWGCSLVSFGVMEFAGGLVVRLREEDWRDGR